MQVRSLKKSILILMASLFTLFTFSAAIAQPLALPAYVAGKHYQILPNPAKLGPADKVEVMEVFWYGCSHCLSFEPMVVAWKKTLADDVAFARTPAVWGRKNTATHTAMQAHAILYYIAEGLELPDTVHAEIFQLIIKNPRVSEPEAFAELFARHGVEKEEFLSQFQSFGIRAKVNKAEKRLGSNYLTQGTPEMVVNGRFRVSARTAGGQKGMLDVVNFLIEQERKLLSAADSAPASADSTVN